MAEGISGATLTNANSVQATDSVDVGNQDGMNVSLSQKHLDTPNTNLNTSFVDSLRSTLTGRAVKNRVTTFLRSVETKINQGFDKLDACLNQCRQALEQYSPFSILWSLANKPDDAQRTPNSQRFGQDIGQTLEQQEDKSQLMESSRPRSTSEYRGFTEPGLRQNVRRRAETFDASPIAASEFEHEVIHHEFLDQEKEPLKHKTGVNEEPLQNIRDYVNRNADDSVNNFVAKPTTD